MGTATFQQGAVVAIDGKAAVLHRKISEVLWQLEDVRTKRVFEHTLEELHSMYATGQLTFTNTDLTASTVRTLTIPNARAQEIEAAKVRRLYAQAVIHLANTEATFSPVIQEIWRSLGAPKAPPHWTTVFRWKKKYLQAGHDFQALLDNTKARGNRSPRYPAVASALVQKAIDEHYLTIERPTKSETLDVAISLVMNENKLRPETAQLPLPTLRHLTTLIEAIPAFDRYAARHGRTAAAKHFRAVLAHRITRAPLERAEIDHTPLDLLAIDDSSGLPLGRPYVTVCIDDYSRCILGIYISFEPPSHFTVSRCLKMAFLPKTELLKQYPAIQCKWNAHGVMRDLVVDNGQEFHSASLENVCYSLGIEIHYSARKTPWFKGKIERFQGTLNRAIAHSTPGTTFSNIFDKEDYDPSKQAILRFSTLKEVIYTWVADVYHQRVHRTLGAPPAVVWENSIRDEDILVPDNPGDLDFMLGRSEQRVLTHKGIELYGLQYNSPELTVLRRTLGEKLDVEIRVDMANLGHIIVLSPSNRQTFKVPALQFEYANGLSQWQHRVCKRYAAREMESFSPSGWLEAKARIRELIESEFLHQKQRTRTKTARFKNMDAPPSHNPSSAKESPAIQQLPNTPSFPPASVHVPQATRPMTASDLRPVSQNQRVRRLKPEYRDRSPSLLAEEHHDLSETNHD